MCASGAGGVMNAVFVLLTVSATVGLVLGCYFPWISVLASGLGLAIVSAMVLLKLGVGLLAGIAIIVACLTLNQVAYLIGARLGRRDPPDR